MAKRAFWLPQGYFVRGWAEGVRDVSAVRRAFKPPPFLRTGDSWLYLCSGVGLRSPGRPWPSVATLRTFR